MESYGSYILLIAAPRHLFLVLCRDLSAQFAQQAAFPATLAHTCVLTVFMDLPWPVVARLVLQAGQRCSDTGRVLIMLPLPSVTVIVLATVRQSGQALAMEQAVVWLTTAAFTG